MSLVEIVAANPRFIELIDLCKAHGMTDAAWSIIHHWRGRDTMEESRTYALHHTFQPGGPNVRDGKRLEVVWGAYQGGGFQSEDEELWVLLAKAALLEIPLE